MKLYKRLSKPHFILWAATAMLLQVREGAPAMQLTLAERLVKRAHDERTAKGSRPSAEEVGEG